MFISRPSRGVAIGVLVALMLVGVSLLTFDRQVRAQSNAQAIPEHASRNPRGGWVCNDGYLKRGESCVAIADATDTEVRQLMVATSIASYSGSCPCPYNTDRAGRRCGGRSAYSRPGGASPLCYEGDITDNALKQFRARYPSKAQRR